MRMPDLVMIPARCGMRFRSPAFCAAVFRERKEAQRVKAGHKDMHHASERQKAGFRLGNRDWNYGKGGAGEIYDRSASAR
jgi:hypothetical protein